MKKKLLIGLAILLVLVIGGIMYLAANANSLIAKYKPDLERLASNALGSHVTLGNLEASVFPSAKVRVDEFRVARKPGSKEALSLRNLMLHVRLLPLLSGNLTIDKLSLEKPELTFIKDASGVSIQGLPKAQPGQSAAESAPQAAPASQPQPGAGPVPAGLGLNLEKFELRDAHVIFKDLTAGKEYHVRDLDIDANVEFGDNVALVPSLSATGVALSNLNFRVNGKDMRYGLGDGEFHVPALSIQAVDGRLDIEASGNVPNSTGKARIGSSGFDLGKLSPLYEIVPALGGFALQGKVTPSINAEWGKGGTYAARGTVSLASVGAVAGGIAVSNLTGQVDLDANQASQKAEAKDLKLALGAEPATLSFAAHAAGKQAKLDSLVFNAFDGTVEANAGFGLEDQRFSSQYAVSGIEIGKAVSVLKPELAAMIAGTLEKVSGNITGALGPDLKQSLAGSTQLMVKNGTLKGVNIAGDVLRAVKDLPFLSGSLDKAAPADKRAELDSPDTQISEMGGNFQIANANLSTQDFKLVSSLFTLSSRGSIGFDAKLDLKAGIAFDPILSAALVEKHKDLKNVQDANGRVVIPLSISGTPPKVLLMPDLEELTRLAARAALEQGAGKLLDKVLKGKGGESGKKKGLGGMLGF